MANPIRQDNFRAQMGMGEVGETEPSAFLSDRFSIADEVNSTADTVTAPFKSMFRPSDMRQLALVAHNHMKPALNEFIETYSDILQNFRITGTETTMRMCKNLWGEDNPEIEYGLACTSGPLGGDAQVAALMCMEDLGGLIFFVDPLSAHPHQADIDSLIRLTNCSNVMMCLNSVSAMGMMYTIKGALEMGNRGMIPSFFQTLESPAVPNYRAHQNAALEAATTGRRPARNMLMNSLIFSGDPMNASRHFSAGLPKEDNEVDEVDNDADDGLDYEEQLDELNLDTQPKVNGTASNDEIHLAPMAMTRRMNSVSSLVGLKEKPKKKTRGLKKIRRGIMKRMASIA